MPIRITGLNSGLDTEAIISALVSSYNYKTNKYKKAQTKLSWKQDAWKTLNTKIYSLYSSVGNLKLSSAYNLKSTTVSDTTKATVTASNSAPRDVYKRQADACGAPGQTFRSGNEDADIEPSERGPFKAGDGDGGI